MTPPGVSRRRARVRAAIAVVTPLLFLLGCAQGSRPFLIVQLCVHDRAGVSQLVGDLKELATSEHMEFFDNSANTARDLKNTGYRGRERSDGSPVVNVGVLRKDGLGVGGGNLGLPGYQVALGFSKGSNDAESRRFANEVVRRLQRRWRVEIVPSGSTAKPLAGCP